MFDRVLDSISPATWTHLFVALSIIAALLVVYVMSLTSFEREDHADPKWLQWFRRTGYLITAVSILMTFDYMNSHKLVAWPPSVFLLVGIIVGSSVRIVAIQLRIRREGHRRDVPTFGTSVIKR